MPSHQVHDSEAVHHPLVARVRGDPQEAVGPAVVGLYVPAVHQLIAGGVASHDGPSLRRPDEQLYSPGPARLHSPPIEVAAVQLRQSVKDRFRREPDVLDRLQPCPFIAATQEAAAEGKASQVVPRRGELPEHHERLNGPEDPGANVSGHTKGPLRKPLSVASLPLTYTAVYRARRLPRMGVRSLPTPGAFGSFIKTNQASWTDKTCPFPDRISRPSRAPPPPASERE